VHGGAILKNTWSRELGYGTVHRIQRNKFRLNRSSFEEVRGETKRKRTQLTVWHNGKANTKQRCSSLVNTLVRRVLLKLKQQIVWQVRNVSTRQLGTQ